MPAVITWFQMPADETDLFNNIEKFGDFVTVTTRGARDPSFIRERDWHDFIGDSTDMSCFIGARNGLRGYHLEEHNTPDGKVYSLPFSAEYIQYDGSFPSAGILHVSNLCAYWTYLSPDKSMLVDKSPQFRNWANKVFALVRRHTPERIEYSGYPYRATVRAAEAHKRGEFEAML